MHKINGGDVHMVSKLVSYLKNHEIRSRINQIKNITLNGHCGLVLELTA